MQANKASKLPSIRSKTTTLVLACAIPTAIGFAALSYDAYTRQRTHLVHDAERMAQALVMALERDLTASETAARALASSPSLVNGDLAAFRAQAGSLLRPDFPAFAFVLSDPAGRPLLNTRFPAGAALPPNGNAESIARGGATGLAATSDLYAGDPRQPQMVSVDVPVVREGRVMSVLSAQLRPEHLNDLLQDLHIPPGWNAQIFDSQANFVARNRNPQRVVGQRANPVLLDAMSHRSVGVVELTSREGVPMLAAYHRAERRGWFVSVGVPEEATRGLLNATLAGLLAAIAGLLAVGVATAWVIGGAISESVRALCSPAAALGRGKRIELPPMAIREADEVASALREVDGKLHRYRTGLQQLVSERTAELERSNSLLASVYAAAPVGLVMVDLDLRVVLINEYLARFNGVSEQGHLGHTFPELFGALGTEYERPFRYVRDTGKALAAKEMSMAGAAEPEVERHWIVSYHPVRGAGQELMGVSAVVLDVTERRALSQRLRDVNEQFRAIYEMSGDAHMLLAQGAGFIGGNQAAARIFGCASVDEFLTLSPATTSPEFQPDGRRSDEKAEQFVRYALETGGAHFEWLHKRRDGTPFHADVLLTSLNIGGRGILQATVRDISTRIAAEKALRATSERLQQSEQFIRTVTDNVPGMVGYWDAALRCQFANRLYQESLGLSEAELAGRPIDQVLSPEDLAENAPHLRAVMAGQAAHFEHEQRDRSGQIRYTWANYIPDFDERKEVRGFYVLIADISEIKRTELRLQSLNEQLIRALDRAEMASSAKTEFLANMSHEIRTPMNAIMGLARLLEEAPLGRRERDYVAKMTMSTRSLLGILNDVLDFSKIEAGQLTLEYTAFPLEQLLRSISVLVAPNAWNKAVELVFDVATDVPAVLSGDPMRIEQVLLNLIGNAVKFTELGEVVLRIAVLARAADDIVLGFSVRDTGVGIPAAQQTHMFEAFSQGDSSTSRRFGGTGLGLAICRRLVHLMDGSIGVTSELGKGSEFRFDCRLGVVPDAAAPAPELAGCRVLLVDDHASVRAPIASQCAAYGCEVDSVASGAEALALLASRSYDMLLVDSAMPSMDGISLLTQARAASEAGLPRVAVMVTESARERLEELADDLQIGAIINKPVTPAALTAALVRLHTGAAPEAGPAQGTALAGRLQGLHVLLVEDNQINQEVANYIMLHAGAAVDIAANGRIAVNMLAEHPARYDAVLMDIQMPVMNGYEATREIRRMGLTALPVVAMTANAMEDDRINAINAGMNGHVAKPIDVDSLVTALTRVTSGGDARELRAPARSGYAYAQWQPLPAPIPGIDLAPTLQRFGGSFDHFVGVFKRFGASQGATVAQVRELLGAGRRDDAVALLHRMRGVAANLGAADVATQALQAEQALRAGAEADLATLDAALAVVVEAARGLAVPVQPASAAAPAVPDLHAALAQLLTLLQNNNLKAIAAFAALRPELEAVLAPARFEALADAIGTLAFANAAVLVQDVLNRAVDEKGSA